MHTPLRYMYIYLYIYVYIIVIMGHSIYTHQLVIMEHPMSSYRTRYGTFHYVICLPESYRRTHLYCPANYSTTRRAYLRILSPYISHHSPCAFISPPCRRLRSRSPIPTYLPLVGVFVTLPPSHVSPPCRRPRHAPPFTRIPPPPCRRLRHTYLPLVSCLRCLINMQLPPPVLLTQPHNMYNM